MKYRRVFPILFALALILSTFALSYAKNLATAPANAVSYPNGTNQGSPTLVKLIVPSVNPASAVVVYSIVTRARASDPLTLVSVSVVERGEIYSANMSAFGYMDCYGATPFLADETGTIQLLVNCRLNSWLYGVPNMVFTYDTGVAARAP